MPGGDLLHGLEVYSLKPVSHRLEEARKHKGQLQKCIRSRSVLRVLVSIWRACVVFSALYGLALKLTAANIKAIRQWFHSSLRAVSATIGPLTRALSSLCAQRSLSILPKASLWR